jgi:hypothetical protein
MVTGEPVNERPQRVTRMVVVMEELGPMCDGGDC